MLTYKPLYIPPRYFILPKLDIARKESFRKDFLTRYRNEINKQLKERSFSEILADWTNVGIDKDSVLILLKRLQEHWYIESINMSPYDAIYLYTFPDILEDEHSLQEYCHTYGVLMIDFFKFLSSGCPDNFITEQRNTSSQIKIISDYYNKNSKNFLLSSLLLFIYKHKSERSYFFLDSHDC